MLSESIDDWAAQWKAQGFEEGLEEGRKKNREEGFVEGQALLLIRFLEDKFGLLDPDVCTIVYHLDEDNLFEHLKRAMTAQTLSEVIGH